MNKKKFDISIVGSGLVGLACAAALIPYAKKGMEIAIIAPKPSLNDTRTTALTPNSKNLLEKWGVWSSLEQYVFNIKRISLTDSLRKEFARIPHLEFTENDNLDPYFFMIHNTVFLDILRKFVVDSPIQSICASVDTHNKHLLHLSTGETIHTGLTIAADGFESPIRTRENIKVERRDYAQSALSCVLCHTKSNQGYAIQHFFETGPLAFLPVQTHKTNIVWSLPHVEANYFCANPDDLIIKVSDVQSHTLGTFSFDRKPKAYPLKTHVAKQFHGKNLALIGEAAHRIHPLAGQGLNQGYKDIDVLMSLIFEHDRLKTNGYLQKSLEKFSYKRHSEVYILQHSQTILNSIFLNQSHAHRLIRQFGMKLFNSSPFLKKIMVKRAAW